MSQDANDPISADDALRFMSDGGDLAKPQEEDKAQTASTDAQGQAIDASALGGEVPRARNTMHPGDYAAYEAATSARAFASSDLQAGEFTLPDDDPATQNQTPPMDFAPPVPDSRGHYTNANRMAQHAQTHQFKKMAIPLLLAVGALLLVMCIAMGVMLLTGNMGEGDNTLPIVFVVAALLVSLILLAGAWWFHKEIRSHQQRQEQMALYQQQGMQQPPQYQ